MSTTITTHPITELEFPTVTVCPPRGSNTALNHLLEKVRDVNFTEQERRELLDISKEVFLGSPSKKFAEQVSKLFSVALTLENIRSIANLQASMPEFDKNDMITIRSREPEGTFSSPGFQDAEYKGNFNNSLNSLHYVIDLPKNMSEMVGNGTLAISVETSSYWNVTLPLPEYKWVFYTSSGGVVIPYPQQIPALPRGNWSWFEAEAFCISQGGHLASVTSQQEQDALTNWPNDQVEDQGVWLGGRRKSSTGNWTWSDGRPWGYQPDNSGMYDCVWYQYKSWGSDINPCQYGGNAICSIRHYTYTQTTMSGSHGLIFRSKELELINGTFDFWWYDTMQSAQKNLFQIDWKIKDGSLNQKMNFVTKDLSGKVSSPGYGLPFPPDYNNDKQEFTATIVLPHDIADKIGFGSLLLIISVSPDAYIDYIPSQDIELLTSKPRLQLNSAPMEWASAKEFCENNGGHLLFSPTSEFHWQRLQGFVNSLGLYEVPVWIGGYGAEEVETLSENLKKWPHAVQCPYLWKGNLYLSPFYCQTKFMSICSITA